MLSRKAKPVPMAVVIRDARDASRDYQIPLSRAQELERQGKLHFCDSNRSYMTPFPNQFIR
jgi:hypothetical protein